MRTLTQPRSTTSQAASLLLAVALATACRSPDASDPGSGENCRTPFERTVASKDVRGVRVLFPYEDLADLAQAEIESADLELRVKGKKSSLQRLSIALNGNQTSHPHGKPLFILKSERSGGEYELKAPMKELQVGGSDNFVGFFRRLLAKKGLFVVWVQGSARAQEARLVIKGSHLGTNCQPGTEPTTPPVAGAPIVTLVSTQGSVFEFVADQSGVSFYCSLDGNAAELCSSPSVYSNLPNGSHSFEVFATNAAGLSSDLVRHEWKVDVTGAAVQFNSIEPNKSVTSLSNLQASFSMKDGSSAEFVCSLDGREYSACVSPAVFTGLTDGLHTIDVKQAKSKHKKPAVPAHYAWRVDQIAPMTSFTSVDTGVVGAAEFQFQANESSRFECALDSDVFEACSSPKKYQQLSEGRHQFQVRAIDSADNASQAISHVWSTDITPPEVILGNVVPAQGLTKSNFVSVEFNANEEASFFCSLDGAAQASCSSPYTSGIATEGSHELTIIAVDAAGNSSAAVTAAWAMDFSSPQISFTQIIPSANSYINSTSLTVNIVGNEPVTLEATLDGVAIIQPGSPIELSGLSEGLHTLVVGGIDSAGNISAPISHSFTVDTAAPAAQIVSSSFSGATSATSNEFAFTANEEGVRFECNLDQSGFSSCTSPFAASSLAEGTHSFHVRAIDRAGNVSAEASFSWAIDLTAPSVEIVAFADPVDAASVDFTLSSDDSNAQFFCALDSEPLAGCDSAIHYGGLAVGDHIFRAAARDSVGNQSAELSHNFSVAQTQSLQTFITASPLALSNQGTASFSFSSNLAGVSFQCSLDGAAAVACASPVSYSGLANGNHQFLVQAVSAAGQVDAVGASYSWSIDTMAPQIILGTYSATQTTVILRWTTTEAAVSKINWGVGTSVGNIVTLAESYGTVHEIALSGLTAGTVYSYIITVQDQAGNVSTTSVQRFRTAF